MRLSKRTDVAFTPFCRPDQNTVMAMAKLFYQVEPEQRVDAVMEMLRLTWTKGKDLSLASHQRSVLMSHQFIQEKVSNDEVHQALQRNQQHCDALQQPNQPVMVLRVAEQEFVFNSLYRVWMIESIFSNILQKKYEAESASNESDTVEKDLEIESQNVE